MSSPPMGVYHHELRRPELRVVHAQVPRHRVPDQILHCRVDRDLPAPHLVPPTRHNPPSRLLSQSAVRRGVWPCGYPSEVYPYPFLAPATYSKRCPHTGRRSRLLSVLPLLAGTRAPKDEHYAHLQRPRTEGF